MQIYTDLEKNQLTKGSLSQIILTEPKLILGLKQQRALVKFFFLDTKLHYGNKPKWVFGLGLFTQYI